MIGRCYYRFVGQEERPAEAVAGSAADPAASESPAWQTCGTHRFYLRGDVLFWETHGPMLISDFVVLYELRGRVQRQHGFALVLFDARQQGGLPPETRRYLVTHKQDPPLRGSIAVFGANVMVRTMVSLLQGAARMLGRTQAVSISFGEDETACWALLARERQSYLSAAPGT